MSNGTTIIFVPGSNIFVRHKKSQLQLTTFHCLSSQLHHLTFIV